MKKILRMYLLAAALLAVFVSTSQAQTAPESQTQTAPASQAQITPEKEVEIRKMINVIGLSKMMNQMFTSMQANAPKDLPPEFWDKIREKMKVDDLIELIIPLYDKYFSLEDLKAVNAFYLSSAGQHMIAALPQLMHESMAIGQKWGQQIGQEVAAEISAEQKKLVAPKQ